MRLVRDESGQTLVIVAAFMGLVGLGFLAFAIDVGTLFREKRMAQAAADSAALAAAEEVSNGSSAEQSAANAMAKFHGFDTTLATYPATVVLSTPASGNFSGSSYVKATVSMPIKTLFMGAFSSSDLHMTVSAASIAGGAQTSQTCVCLEGSSGNSLNLSNGSTLNATGCGIVDNSTASDSVTVTGGSTFTANSLGTVSSSWTQGSNVGGGSTFTVPTIVTGVASSCGPTMPTAPSYGSCASDPGGSYGTFTFGPASAGSVICYQALTVGANGSTCTLSPGTYVITTGQLHFESGANGHSNLGGNGVFFYLTGTASLAIDNGANVNLVAGGSTLNGGGTAPTVGSYNGILVYQNASDTSGISVQGGSTTYMNGALYAPTADITLSNGTSTNIMGGIAAASLTLTGGSSFTPTTDANEGSLTIGSPKMLQ
jgi:Flp pilus assembly protein TadG